MTRRGKVKRSEAIGSYLYTPTTSEMLTTVPPAISDPKRANNSEIGDFQ